MAGCPLVAANSMEIEKVSSFLLQIREKDQLTTQVPPQPVKVVLGVPKPRQFLHWGLEYAPGASLSLRPHTPPPALFNKK
jgi:hypothetical protein